MHTASHVHYVNAANLPGTSPLALSTQWSKAFNYLVYRNTYPGLSPQFVTALWLKVPLDNSAADTSCPVMKASLSRLLRPFHTVGEPLVGTIQRPREGEIIAFTSLMQTVWNSSIAVALNLKNNTGVSLLVRKDRKEGRINWVASLLLSYSLSSVAFLERTLKAIKKRDFISFKSFLNMGVSMINIQLCLLSQETWPLTCLIISYCISKDALKDFILHTWCETFVCLGHSLFLTPLHLSKLQYKDVVARSRYSFVPLVSFWR